MVEYLLGTGFLGTRASLEIDLIMLFLTLLPILVWGSIWLAIHEYHKLHRQIQTVLFYLSVVVLTAFFYSLYFHRDLEALMVQSFLSMRYAVLLFIVHGMVVMVSVLMWFSTLFFAKADQKRRALPGLYSLSHKASGRRTFVAIVITSVSTLALYIIVFVASK
jgi:hypothetical protein